MKLKRIAINIITGLVLLLPAMELYAQSAKGSAPSVIGAAGGTAVQSTLTLDWTLGEVFVESITDQKDRWYTEGFHQPLLTVRAYPAPLDSRYTIQIAPNPTPDRLDISIQTNEPENLTLRLLDVTGKTLLLQTAPPRTSTLQWSLKHLPEGMYMLSFINAKGIRINSFKIIKH